MSLSCLTCNMAPRRDGADDPFDGPQPQTATCCTALKRGYAADGLAQHRYAPLRTPASLQEQAASGRDNDGGGKKKVRKCKSTVADMDVSQLMEGPQLRRSGGVRRDWSFEDLRGRNAA